MKLTLEIEISDEFARAIATKLGMKMTTEVYSEAENGEPMIDELPVSNQEIDEWLETHMKNTMSKMYSKVVEDIKLAELDSERKQQELEIKDIVDASISVGSSISAGSEV